MLSSVAGLIALGIDALVRGSFVAWLSTAGLWLFAVGVVLTHERGARSSGLRVLALLSLTSVTAMAGLCVATAVAIPRLRWAAPPNDSLVLPKGDTWKRLRGPTVAFMDDGQADLAVPTIDKDGRWVLVGLLSGRAVDGLNEAPIAPPSPGSPRLCATESDACRAWPDAWPKPTQAARSADLSWTVRGDPLSALAFDVESGLYLTSLGSLAGDEPVFELIGRVSNDPPRDTFSALFVLRRLTAGRLQATRVVSSPDGDSYVFQLQRSDVSLGAGPLALRVVARPVLTALALSLPLGLVAYLVSPLLLAAWRRRREAEGPKDAVAWLTERLRPLALSAAGAAIAVPGLVAIASLFGAR